LSDEKNTSNSKQETITISTDDPKKIKELEKQLAEKEQQVKDSEKQVQEIKQKTIEAIKKIKQEARNEENVRTDLTKKVIKQNTFKHSYRNGYADGTVEEEKKKILAERKKAKAGTR